MKSWETDGINQRMRRLLKTKFTTVRLPQAKEGPPRASNSPSLVYSSKIKPQAFQPGVGMDIPPKVETWVMDVEEGMA